MTCRQCQWFFQPRSECPNHYRGYEHEACKQFKPKRKPTPPIKTEHLPRGKGIEK